MVALTVRSASRLQTVIFSIVTGTVLCPPPLPAPAQLVALSESTAGEPDGFVGFRTMNEILDASAAQRRFQIVLLGAFGVPALLLSILGAYGITPTGPTAAR